MDLKKEGRQLALALVNIDDVVLVRELSGTGANLLSLAGRSAIGTAVVGAGMATRAALLGAQLATKSALAVAGAAKGRIPGAGVAERMVYELDKTLGRSGETASAVASQGIALGKTDGQPPTEPIFGDVWLGKRLKPGATAGSVLVDSAIDLTRLAALPLTLGTTTLANALASPAGYQVTKSFWDAVSAIVDTATRSPADGTKTDRSEQRATLLMVGITPLVTTVQDILDLGEGLTRASTGDGRQLRTVLTTALRRVDASQGASKFAEHKPARLFSALEQTSGDGSARAAAIGRAIVEDSGTLSRLAVAYTTMVAGLVTTSLQSAVNGARDVGAIEAWVRADETSRDAGGNGVPEKCPASIKQLESVVAAFYAREADARHSFFVPSTIELARDTIFSYSYRAVGREAALARMERLFGAAVRDRLRDDCSLWGEIIDAKGDRDVRLAALVSQLQSEGHARLREARDHAAERLESLTSNSPDQMLGRIGPQRIGERIAILQRFIGLADTANALDPLRLEEARRQRVAARFSEWMAAPATQPEAQPA